MPDVGKVTYRAEVDISGLNDDIKKAESTIKNSDIGESLASEINEGAQKASESVKKAADDINESTDSASGKSTAMSVAVGSAMLQAGNAVLDFGKHMVGVTVDYDSALAQMQAATGASADEMEKYGAAMEAVYANNYGDSFGDIADAMSQIRQQIGPVVDAWDTDAIQNLTEDALYMSDTFGYGTDEIVRATAAMMNMGVDGADAMNLIAEGTQNGLDFSGELLDSISEYSVQFQKLGLDADDMFKIFQAGADSGAFNLDKIGDAVKEFSIRVIDGSDTTKEGFEAIGLNADEMAARFAAGGDSAKAAFEETIEALASMEDPLAQNTAGVNLFGTMWEDLGPAAITALAGIEEGAYGSYDALNQMQEISAESLSNQLGALQRSVESLLMPLMELLVPVVTQIIEAILPALQAILEPLIPIIASVIEPINQIVTALMPLITLIMETLSPLLTMLAELFSQVFSQAASAVSGAINTIMPVLQTVVNFVSSVLSPVISALSSLFSSVFGSILSTVNSVIQNITGIFQGIIDFVKNVFTGNWSGAWEAVVSIFDNIIQGIANIFKAPINWIIDGINTFIGGLNKLKIPDWVPIVGGKGFNIPKIPRLKAGIDYVPSDFYPAFLDKGEMVLTAEEASAYRSVGGMANIGSVSYGGRERSAVQINVPLYLDSREVARATAWYTGEQLSWEEM